MSLGLLIRGCRSVSNSHRAQDAHTQAPPASAAHLATRLAEQLVAEQQDDVVLERTRFVAHQGRQAHSSASATTSTSSCESTAAVRVDHPRTGQSALQPEDDRARQAEHSARRAVRRRVRREPPR